jgi:hypothetical protein
VGCLAGRAEVALFVAESAVAGAVVGVVWREALSGQDRLGAAAAEDEGACLDQRFAASFLSLVVGAVASLGAGAARSV